MEDIKNKNHMSAIYSSIDNSTVSLWIETAGLVAFLSIVFWATITLF